MEVWLAENDKHMFLRYLDKCTHYFEFGSGGSTYEASKRDNIKNIYSVESDREWHNKLKTIIQNKANITFIHNEMDTKPNTWGYPGNNSTPEQKKRYSDQIVLLDESKTSDIDLIFIDGRFRVACCLKCFDQINDECIIAFDDFLNRQFYHVVLKYYDIIEKTIDNRMVILKKKKNVLVPREEIIKYESIQQ